MSTPEFSDFWGMERVFDEAHRQMDEAELEAALALEYQISEDNAADGFLKTLRDEPWMMNAAPVDYTPVDMHNRSHEPWHSCLRCGRKSQVALIADTRWGPRWLDICHQDLAFIIKHSTAEPEYTP